MNYLYKLINWHKAQIGTKETGKNINKYADDMAKNYPEFLNANKQGYDWCAVYQMDGFCQVYGMDNALKMLNLRKNNFAAGCTPLRNYFMSNKSYYNTPKVGDLIFFDWDRSGDADHVGFVLDVNDNTIITVEGNSSDMVKSNYYKTNDIRIIGYGRPNYDAEEIKPKQQPERPNTDNTTVRVLKRGRKGDDVRKLQTNLNKIMDGVNLEVDGSFGPLTEAAVRTYQTIYGLEVDGIFGPASRKKMEALLNQHATSYMVKVTAKDGLNLRAGAGEKHAVLTAMPNGTVLQINQEQDGWGYTVYNNISGWCYLKYTSMY